MSHRIIYATKGLAVKTSGTGNISSQISLQTASGLNPTSDWEVPRGVQSVGITTTFNLEQVFQQGQLNLYENIEDRPDIEMTVSRVLDGTHPLYLMASDDGNTTVSTTGAATAANLFTTGRSLNLRNAHHQIDLALLLYPDESVLATGGSGGGTPEARVMCSGMFLSSISYTFPVDGTATEDVTFVGNNKAWDTTGTGGSALSSAGFWPSANLITAEEDATDTLPVASGVTRREDIDLARCVLPSEVNDQGQIQNITVSVDLGRDELFSLGTKDAFHRVISFPVEVTCSIETITSRGDQKDAIAAIDNLSNEQIKIFTKQGLVVDLGLKNKMSSVDFTGGDTGGGEVTCTYNYSNFNDFTVTHAFYI